ncbi:hypothetical protein AgCh_022124 [Apium graveolens]
MMAGYPCILQDKRHFDVRICSLRHDEGYLRDISNVHGYLIVARKGVKKDDDLVAIRGVYQLINARQRILKNGPFIPMKRVPECTNGDMVIPAHFAPKDPSTYIEPEKEKGSSSLVANDKKISEDELEPQTQVVQAVHQKNKEPQKPVILELEDDEFYTLDELDEMDQSMAYLARKFSNIKVKRPKKGGYKSGSVDRSKIRCYNCDELGHFATKCKKPKKVNKYKAYLELEANEVELKIKQEIADEDKERKGAESTPIIECEKKPVVNQTTKTPTKEIKTENNGKKKKNRNRKIGVNKSNNYAYIADAPRK